MKFTVVLKGGPGSGHRGHSGRPGKRGGSLPGSRFLAPDVPVFGNAYAAQVWAEQNIAKNVDYGSYAGADVANDVMAELLAATGEDMLGHVIVKEGEWQSSAQLMGSGGITIGGHMWGQPLGKTEKSWHSKAYFDNETEAVVRHEFGHIFKYRNERSFNVSAFVQKAGQPWQEAFGITARARDTWDECVAENFVLFSIGQVEGIHPVMIETFETLTRY